MLTALFDIITGISGDMTIAALLDAGADFKCLRSEIAKLGLRGFELQVSKKSRSGIEATKFDVIVHEKPHNHTNLEEIFSLISNSSLSDFVKSNSKKIFQVIGEAESKVHNVPLPEIHFHEVGAIDSIIDIVGACLCLENLEIEKVYSTPVKLGKGLINTQHGIMPNPAPATLEILKDYPVEFTGIDFELTTPTGAAIIKSLSSGVYTGQKFSKIKQIGFGSGSFDIKESPNLLRVIICEDEIVTEKLLKVETNIDDMNPQIYPYVLEKLLEAGANDVYYHDVIMKKGRPGILLSVLTPESVLNEILNIIYSETTTIGVRIINTQRHKLPREIKETDTSFGKLKVKLIYNGAGKVKTIPEFEECKRVAQQLGKPVNEIYNTLMKELNN